MKNLQPTPDLLWILGRPNFDCANYAQYLRNTGQKIPCKSEAEQAAVILWMLNAYLADQQNWQTNLQQEIRNFRILQGIDPDDK